MAVLVPSGAVALSRLAVSVTDRGCGRMSRWIGLAGFVCDEYPGGPGPLVAAATVIDA